MTIVIALSNASDAGVFCHNASYATMQGGSSRTLSGAGTFITFGQSFGVPFAGEYVDDQAFLDFPYTKDTASMVVSAMFSLTSDSVNSTGQTRNAEVYEQAWGGVVDVTDWRFPSQFASMSLLAVIKQCEQASSGLVMRGSSTALLTRLDTTGDLLVVVTEDRFRTGSTPSTDERQAIRSADYSGTSEDPALIYSTVPLSFINRTLGAQCQLSDGTHVVLEALAAEASLSVGNIKLRRVSATGTATDIATLSLGTASVTPPTFASSIRGGQQSFALVVDASDNIYVMGPSSNGSMRMCCQAFVKGVGLTWTPATRLDVALSTYDTALGGFAAAWHSVGGSKGTLVVVAQAAAGTAARSVSDSEANQTQVALVSADSLLAGSGTVVRGTASFASLFTAVTDEQSWYHNETLTGLDVFAAPGTSNTGYAISYNSDDGGNYQDPTTVRYKLASDGASFTSTADDEWTLTSVLRDANSKLRVVGIDSTRWAIAGGVYPFMVLQNVSGSSQTQLGAASLSSLTVASKPASINDNALWDVIHDAAGNKLWLYYVDASRRLVRTSFNLSTYLPANDEVVVSAAVGAVGSTNYAIRCNRGALTSPNLLISIANKTSGGTHSVIYQTDTINVAPNAPVLTPQTNFDATTARAFAWAFSDPNAGDTQSAFEIDIDTAAGANAYDSGEQLGQVSYVGAGTSATGNNASVTPGTPAGVAEGDVVVVVASIRSSGTGTVTLPAGWTDLVNFGNVRAFAKRYTATGFTMPTVAFASGAAGDDTIGQSFAIRGSHQDLASILSGTTGTVLNASAQNVTYPALTIPDAGTLAVILAWKQDDATSYTTPAGWSAGSFDAPIAGNDASQAVFYKQSGAATIASAAITVTGGAAAISRGITLAFKPHPGNTGGTFTLPANVLTNGTSYQWRARTWDAAGLVGAWSAFSTFQVATGGTVTITDPVADNPPNIITSSYPVAWSVSATTQQDYRVVVVRQDTGATVQDSGWVTSAATTFTITGMISDVTHQIQVTVRNASLVQSGTGLRLITPSFGTPEAPTITVAPQGDAGYTQVAVTNPVPGSVSLGTTTATFESAGDAAGYNATSGTLTTGDTTHFNSGAAAAKFVTTGTPTQAYFRPVPASAVAVTVGRRYTAIMWVYSVAGYANVQAAIDWLDGSKAYLSTSSFTVSVPAATWTLVTVTGTAPASAAYATYGPTLASSPATGTTVWVDDMIIVSANDKPDVASNQILRRTSGTTDVFTVIGTVAKNGAYQDFAAASGVAYDYEAVSVATTGAATSAIVVGTLTLVGVWLYDVLTPAASAANYQYGRALRIADVDTMGQGTYYAGRQYPVVDFGEFTASSVQVKIQVSHGPDWAAQMLELEAFMALRRTVCFRDNRGRKLFGTLSAYEETDEEWGTTVAFTVTAVDYSEAVA